ncbi:MAG TPA: hypothetical protein VEZ14_08680 [Dehalococcoidia bacterium]|nr:hypothetical protein [Dehalococcoidia bacterium]
MTTGADPADALRRRLLAALPEPARLALEAIIAAAAGPIYAAGGVPRDLLLGRAFADIDLVVEADDAAALLRAAVPGGRVTAHARFGTASTSTPGTRIDIAGARSETYARPGALPRTRSGSIEDDLRRRDFSINALALRLNRAPALLDPCGGMRDLRERRIRVLHERSFADDPTRIFRALRYAARLDFALDAETARLLRESVIHIPALSGDRVRRELELILTEETAGRAMEACQATGVLRMTHPALRWDTRCSAALASGGGATVVRGCALLAAGASAADAEAIVARLRLTRQEAAAVRAMPALASLSPALRRPAVKPSGVAMLLDRFPAAAVAAFSGVARDGVARGLALRYLGEWRQVKPALSGRDLQELGVPAGPQIKRGLQLIRAARLDGWASDRNDERALAARFARSIRDSASAAPRPEHPLGD